MHATLKSASARVVHLATAALTAAVIAGCAQPEPSPEPPAPKVVQVTSDTAFDASDRDAVAGWADAIFVGTVEKYLDTKAPASGTPETQFQVSVVTELKGDLPAKVVVNQIGGMSHDHNLIVVDGMPLISSTKTYLFIARYYAEKKWLTIANGLGATELTGPNRANTQPEPDAVERMRDAIAHQKPFGDENTRPKLPDPATLPSDITDTPIPPQTPSPTPTPTGTGTPAPTTSRPTTAPTR
ncbi:hypothetical protein [Nocardia sp. NPDC051570]|uniref:hypothetical protein n=1 Tax=Nocardia sp. NPDC051570 TaxID=3364324 RepID=UPI00379A5E3E